MSEYRTIKGNLDVINRHLGSRDPRSLASAFLESGLINYNVFEKLSLEITDNVKADYISRDVLAKVKAESHKYFDFIKLLVEKEFTKLVNLLTVEHGKKVLGFFAIAGGVWCQPYTSFFAHNI